MSDKLYYATRTDSKIIEVVFVFPVNKLDKKDEFLYLQNIDGRRILTSRDRVFKTELEAWNFLLNERKNDVARIQAIVTKLIDDKIFGGKNEL